jgi:hypothetical protein
VQLVTPPMMGMSMLMPILVSLIEPGTWDMSSMSMMGGWAAWAAAWAAWAAV